MFIIYINRTNTKYSSTIIPSIILYQPNTLKSCFLIYPIKNFIANTDTINAITMPNPRVRSYELVKSKSNFNSLNALAPNIVGTARKKLNSAAATLDTPIISAPIMVAPGRDVPGIRDST